MQHIRGRSMGLLFAHLTYDGTLRFQIIFAPNRDILQAEEISTKSLYPNTLICM